MLQSDLITTNNMSHHQPPPPPVLMDELLLSSTHLMSEAQPSSASYHPPPPPPPPPPAKKKRSLPGHPDPGAEVIALSPNSLLATNRFMCEICNKGFQRDQNLQLHRRGHNLPWKLKQRPKDEAVRKKVYVCPEPGCVHNDPARALGDLTGIKKHFYRKHGEKKWKCDKCSKKYAVQSDWKAHSKTCGTKEYRCDCGTLFSRRDSFITHRAFCDALVEDTARAFTSNPFLPPPQLQQQQQEAAAAIHHDHHQSPVATSSSPHQNMLFLQNPDPQLIPQQQQPHPSESLQTHIPNLIPTWLQAPPLLPSSSSSTALLFSHDQLMQPPLQNPSHVIGGPNYPPPPPQPHLSATALLQKAAQLGAIISSKTASSTSPLPAGVVTAQPPPPMTAGFGLNMSSYEQQQEMGNITPGFFAQGCGGGPGSSTFRCSGGGGGSGSCSSSSSASLLRDLMMMKSMPSFDGDNMPFGNDGISDGLTRDFLGLRPLIHHGDHDIVNLSMAGLGDTTNAASSSSQEHKNEW